MKIQTEATDLTVDQWSTLKGLLGAAGVSQTNWWAAEGVLEGALIIDGLHTELASEGATVRSIGRDEQLWHRDQG